MGKTAKQNVPVARISEWIGVPCRLIRYIISRDSSPVFPPVGTGIYRLVTEREALYLACRAKLHHDGLRPSNVMNTVALAFSTGCDMFHLGVIDPGNVIQLNLSKLREDFCSGLARYRQESNT